MNILFLNTSSGTVYICVYIYICICICIYICICICIYICICVYYMYICIHIPYSGKFSPGVKFRQFRQSVEVAKIKSVNFLSRENFVR